MWLCAGASVRSETPCRDLYLPPLSTRRARFTETPWHELVRVT